MKKMRVVILVAIGNNGAIGVHGRLPWQGQQRADMRRFVELTTGFPIIVGRKTYESFPKRPLPNRVNIVVTRNSAYGTDGCVVAASLQQAFAVARDQDKDKVFVIGGVEIYRQALPHADELDITFIHGDFEADTFFPELDLAGWQKTHHETHDADEKNRNSYSFFVYTRCES